MGVGERLACRIIAGALRDRVGLVSSRLDLLETDLTIISSCRASTLNLFRWKASSTGTSWARTLKRRPSRQTVLLSSARRSTRA